MQNQQRVSRQQDLYPRLYGMLMTMLMALVMSQVQVARADINVPCGDVASLIAAINTANTAGGDTITLAVGCQYLLAVADNSGANGANGLPVITSPITINGNGSTIARVSIVAFRILEVAPGGNLTVNNLTISNGNAGGIGNAGNGGGIFISAGGLIAFSTVTADTAAVVANSAANDGGGIYIAPGGLIAINLITANSSVAMHNSAGRDGGGIYIAQNASLALQGLALNSSVAMHNSAGRDGGGIYIAQGGIQSAELASLNGSVVMQNSAGHDGGGIYVTQGGALDFQGVTLNSSVAMENNATNDGGGIYIAPGGALNFQSVTLNSSAVQANESGRDGGGIYVATGSVLTLQFVTLTTSVISDNQADRNGGGLYLAAGGILSLGTVDLVALTGSMVYGNQAGENGGGVYIGEGGTLSFQFATISSSVATKNRAANDGGGIYIAQSGTLTFQSVTLDSSVANANRADRDGGGIYIAQDSTLSFQDITLNSSAVNANRAGNDGGGLYIAMGGALSFQGVTLNSSPVNANRAGHDGGGLYIAQSSNFTLQAIALNGTSVNANRAENNGGGIFNAGGTVNLMNGRVNGNQAGYDGGGLYNLGGTLKLTHYLINGNKAGHDGGGIFNTGIVVDDEGTPVVVAVGNLFLTDSKVNGNKAGHADAGIANAIGGSLTIDDSKVEDLPPFIMNFTQINEPGFGDHQISYAWTTGWFKGKLYVGLNKNAACGESAAVNVFLPGFYTTNPQPGVTCAPTPQDVDFRGEIWAYTPETQQWARVYQSPEIPIPLFPGKQVALDVGYRGMAVFQEPNGGPEALYVSGVSSRDFNCVPQPPPASCLPLVPPPRILRSTDGVTFTPLPQAPGTVLGDLTAVSFRSMVVYTPPDTDQPHLYVIAGRSVGDGEILEAADPAGGNDNFKLVSGMPEGITAFELTVFNDFLYVGGAGYDLDLDINTGGYSVLKTDATGPLPYTFTTIVDHGAGRGDHVMAAVSMHPFKGKLYVGANGWFPPNVPIVSELIRISPDDTWELVVGNPRPINHQGIPCPTNSSVMCPTSGLPDGFGNFFNAHFWRMQEHNGILYLGTNDSSVQFRGTILEPFIKDEFGADLWASQDGDKWVRLKRDGFGNIYNFGIRTFASSPDYGLFVGTANQVTGAEVYLGRQETQSHQGAHSH